jgi:hypothetical protein
MVFTGDPPLSFGTISSTSVIGPLNIPYGRVSDRLQDVMDNLYTNYIPWEWYIDYTGKIHMIQGGAGGYGQHARDKTAIQIVHGQRLNEVDAQRSIKQTAQRVRVTGSGEGKEQDDNTSDWQEDATAMGIANTFYEKLEGNKEITKKDMADIFAKVLLTELKDPREEITINDVDLLPYTANDVDIADYITVTDSWTGLSGPQRIKTYEKTIDAMGGEVVNLTLTKKRTDISDRLADIYKTLQKLLNSSMILDKLRGEGMNQQLISANNIEDVWEQTSSNKWFTELPETDINAEAVITNCLESGTGLSYACDKDIFVVTCNPNSWGKIIQDQPRLKYSRDPRFTCEFEIDTNIGDDWVDGDTVYILIYQVDDAGGICDFPYGVAGFGFRIQMISGVYRLTAYLYDRTKLTTIEINVAILAPDVKYIIEARLSWKEKIIQYYFGKADVDASDPEWGFRLRGILPIDMEDPDEDNLVPFYMTLSSTGVAHKIVIPIYHWRTQAIRAVKE